MRIFIVRHGEPDYERDCLTETGKQQAKEAALRLRNEGIQEIYSSPMGRALETAQETSDLLGIRPIRILPFMHELQWGSKDGTPVFSNGHPWDIAGEMIRLDQDLTDPQWPESPMFRNNTVTESALLVMRETDRWLAGLGYVREGHYYRKLTDSKHQRLP